MRQYIILSFITWFMGCFYATAQNPFVIEDKWQDSFEQNHYEWQDSVKGDVLRLDKNVNYRAEFQASMSDGYTPLWLNANKYGVSSIEGYNGYARGSIERPLETDDSRHWGIGYGLDLVGAYNYTSKMFVQQAYIEGRWNHCVITIGQKEYPMEMKENRLSSGSQAFGINARPVPQARFAIPKYWAVPGLKDWVHVKGHLSYGFLTDNSWQRSFTDKQTNFAENTLYHSKAGYMKIGKEGHPLSFEIGLEMGCLFNGTTYHVDNSNTFGPHKENSGFKSFWHAFLPGGKDASDGQYANASGDQLGSWLLRLNYEKEKWAVGVYADHFFEDHSQMFFVDYNGWGEGEEYNKAKEMRMFMHKIKDMLLGVDLKLRNNDWLNKIVFEYVYTKYQSGPINHDRTSHISDHYAGRDDYYNHSRYAGWQHWGQVIGNPLYRSPIYNTDGQIMVENNRFVAFHLGVEGRPIRHLSYRVLASWQEGFGTYDHPFFQKEYNLTAMAEATYHFQHNWCVTTAIGFDQGKILGNNRGIQLTIMKYGILGK